MKIFRSRAAGTLAAAAALSLTATPAMARGWGWRHHDGIDAGDIFAGLLIVGGIAAIAAAASKSHKDDQARDDGRYPDRTYQQAPAQGYDGRPDYPGDDPRNAPGRAARAGVGMDDAADACADSIERGQRRVGTIDSVDRDGQGWRVQGRDRAGHDFECLVGADGRVHG